MDYSYEAVRERFLSEGALPFLKKPELPLPGSRVHFGGREAIPLVCQVTGAKKFSDIIYFMVYSLIKQEERDRFVIDMDTYGAANGSFCFGCAATCALQEMSGVLFGVKDTQEEFRERIRVALGISYEEENRIEWFFNSLRTLDKYSIPDPDVSPEMEVTTQMVNEFLKVPALRTETWKLNIGEFVKLADKWSAEGY